jgi:hypothetical protein
VKFESSVEQALGNGKIEIGIEAEGIHLRRFHQLTLTCYADFASLSRIHPPPSPRGSAFDENPDRKVNVHCEISHQYAGPWRRAAAKPQDGCGNAAGPQLEIGRGAPLNIKETGVV